MLTAPATCTPEMPTKPRPFPFLTVTQPSHTRTAKLTSYTMLKQWKRPITKAIYLHSYHFLTERTNQTWYIAGNKNWKIANSNQYSFKNYFYRYNWLVCLKKFHLFFFKLLQEFCFQLHSAANKHRSAYNLIECIFIDNWELVWKVTKTFKIDKLYPIL